MRSAAYKIPHLIVFAHIAVAKSYALILKKKNNFPNETKTFHITGNFSYPQHFNIKTFSFPYHFSE